MGLLLGRDDEEMIVFIGGLSSYMAFERDLTARDRDILRHLPSKAAGSHFFSRISPRYPLAITLGYHCIHKMDEYKELWKAEQRKAHLYQVKVDRIRAGGQRVVEILKRNGEKSRRLFLEKNNLAMEVAKLKEDLASIRAELKREMREFEAKVQRRIDQHMDQVVEQPPLEHRIAVVDLEAEEAEHIAENPTHGTVEDKA
ncbi:hypothetical protein U1Q18_007006 [Sarracenia purpurea var. burkii]